MPMAAPAGRRPVPAQSRPAPPAPAGRSPEGRHQRVHHAGRIGGAEQERDAARRQCGRAPGRARGCRPGSAAPPPAAAERRRRGSARGQQPGQPAAQSGPSQPSSTAIRTRKMPAISSAPAPSQTPQRRVRASSRPGGAAGGGRARAVAARAPHGEVSARGGRRRRRPGARTSDCLGRAHGGSKAGLRRGRASWRPRRAATRMALASASMRRCRAAGPQEAGTPGPGPGKNRATTRTRKPSMQKRPLPDLPRSSPRASVSTPPGCALASPSVRRGPTRHPLEARALVPASGRAGPGPGSCP